MLSLNSNQVEFSSHRDRKWWLLFFLPKKKKIMISFYLHRKKQQFFFSFSWCVEYNCLYFIENFIVERKTKRKYYFRSKSDFWTKRINPWRHRLDQVTVATILFSINIEPIWIHHAGKMSMPCFQMKFLSKWYRIAVWRDERRTTTKSLFIQVNRRIESDSF